MTSNRSHNALSHGAYGREAVLPWEDLQEFARLHQSIRDELDPSGALEEEAVREVAELVWRKRRLAMAFMLPVYKDPPSADLLEAAKGGIVGLAGYLAKPAQGSSGAFLATATQALDYVKSRLGTGKPASGQSPPQALLSVSKPSVVERAYDPAAMERQLRIEARIDSRIAKIIARLVGLKDYKVIYGPEPMQMLPAADTPALTRPAAATTNTRK